MATKHKIKKIKVPRYKSGDEFILNNGEKAVIKKYINVCNVIVIMPDGKEYRSTISNLKIGSIPIDYYNNQYTPISDHLGNKYKSETSMCKAYGISPATYSSRIKAGYSKKEALTSKQWNHTVTDHLGNEYSSNEEMAKAYGLKTNTLQTRLRRGWSLEKALTEPLIANKKKCKDTEGNQFTSLQKMCNAHNISWSAFKGRIKKGMSIEEALSIPATEKGAPYKYGETVLMKCGFRASAGNIISSKEGKKKEIEVIFEDGEKVSALITQFRSKQLTHPAFRSGSPSIRKGKRRYYIYGNLLAWHIPNTEYEAAFYECECRICGRKDVLTPQEMIKGCSHDILKF